MEIYEIYAKNDLEFFKLNGNSIIAFTEYIVNMKRYEDE